MTPDSIRTFLDGGGDPTELEEWKALAEDMLTHRAVVGDDKLRSMYGESFVAEMGANWELYIRWLNELLDDDQLAARFEAALPPDVVDELTSTVEDERG